MRDTLHFAWLPDAGSCYLLGCWLRGLPVKARVLLLAPPELREAAGGVIEGVPAAVEVWDAVVGQSLPEPCAALLAAQSDPCITLPIALDMVPMRYQPALMPAIPAHYPAIRQVWQWGFRSVRFAGHGSGPSFAIPHLLDRFHQRHRGERCFVVGNGPSLNAIDMTRLKDEITLGSNRCFLGYEAWGYPFTYWGVYDKYQIEAYHPVYQAGVPSETVKFFPVEYLPVLPVAEGCPVNSVWPKGVDRAFSATPDAVYVGFTVTYMLMQIAACMGCDPIILIGVDHRYELRRRGYIRLLRSLRRAAAQRLRGGRLYESAVAAHHAWRKGQGQRRTPALWSTEDASHPTHFTAAYTAGGRNRFLPPEPEEAERDFACARAWAESHGRSILNATPGTALESFPKVDFKALF